MSAHVYCIDSSAVLDWLERYYPEEAFPALIERMDSLINAGRLLMSEEVLEELVTKDEAAKRWCEPRQAAMVVETDAAVALAVREVLREYPRLVGALKNRSRADPFVIAVAQLKSAVVVTGETGGTADRPKIPFVCEQLAVGCIGFLDLIKAERWRF
jgi:hypothetical protein